MSNHQNEKIRKFESLLPEIEGKSTRIYVSGVYETMQGIQKKDRRLQLAKSTEKHLQRKLSYGLSKRIAEVFYEIAAEAAS